MGWRDTKWRQGSVLSHADAVSLCLIEEVETTKKIIIISHDCDIAHQDEPSFEYIIGIICNPDGNLRWAKNVRRLHIEFHTLDDPIFMELSYQDRGFLEKNKCIHIIPDPNFNLHNENKRLLKQWLAGRYGRPAFPNAFNERLRPLTKKIEKACKKNSSYILAIYFDLGEQHAKELPDGEPYILTIRVVYDTDAGEFSQVRQSVQEIAKNIEKLFLDKFQSPELADSIALEQCIALSEHDITLADVRRIHQWELEHISFKDEAIAN